MRTYEYNSMIELIKEVRTSYDLGLQYLTFDYNGNSYKIRMNKDHSWATKNNNHSVNNLSLINRPGNGSEMDVYRSEYNIAKDKEIFSIQKYGVMDVEDVIKEVRNFIDEVEFCNN